MEFRVYHLNKVGTLVDIVNKFVPPNLDSQEYTFDIGLSDLCFGSELSKVLSFFYVVYLLSYIYM